MGIASKEKRRIAIEAIERGLSQVEVAYVVGSTERTVRRWVSEYRQTGKEAPAKRGHPACAFNEEQLAQLEALLQKQPDLSLVQIKEQLGLSCHISTVNNYIRNKLGWRYKKHTSSQ